MLKVKLGKPVSYQCSVLCQELKFLSSVEKALVGQADLLLTLRAASGQ